jgi:hypothetical protein
VNEWPLNKSDCLDEAIKYAVGPEGLGIDVAACRAANEPTVLLCVDELVKYGELLVGKRQKQRNSLTSKRLTQ